jgi:hypothetical protein
LSNVSLLDHAKADTLVAYSASGTAFQMGGAGTTKIRNNYPKTLDFTGRAFSVGLEFAIHPSSQ